MNNKIETLKQIEKSHSNTLFHFDLNVDEILIVTIDVQDKTKNWFDDTCIDILYTLFDYMEKNQPKGLIFISGKRSSFIQGLSLSKLENKTREELIFFTNKAQSVINRIKALPIPTVAAIHGSCFGLGLELILACDYRVATHNHITEFAMPQVRSGMLPYAGGCYELTRVLGLRNSLELLLTGNKVSAKWALQHNLVDELVRYPVLNKVAQEYVLSQPEVTGEKKVLNKWNQKIDAIHWVRSRILEKAQESFWHKEFGHYPAIDAIIGILKSSQEKEIKLREQKAFVKLYCGETSKILRSLVYAQRRMRMLYLDIQSEYHIKNIAILGSGFMGAGLAFITATRAQLPVRIKATSPSGVSKALRLSHILLQREVVRGNLPFGRLQQMIYLISGSNRIVDHQPADVVIEAVYEDLELKQDLILANEQLFHDNTIFASNTSSFLIADVAEKAPHPENVIGMHYLTPVNQQKLVEIIPHAGTSSQTIVAAVSLAIQQGQVPFLVKDSPGFFINRLLIPYLLEAFSCLCEGESIESIDLALKQFGFTYGPITMLDEMGLDLLAKILPNLSAKLGSHYSVPDKLHLLLDDNRKGRKNKHGFYLYHSTRGNRVAVDFSVYQVLEVIIENNLEPEQIVRRCLLMMLNEAANCLYEGVITNIEEANVASVLGLKFPQFRGGIYAYMEKVGYDVIIGELELMAKTHGERFTPSPWFYQ